MANKKDTGTIYKAIRNADWSPKPAGDKSRFNIYTVTGLIKPDKPKVVKK